MKFTKLRRMSASDPLAVRVRRATALSLVYAAAFSLVALVRYRDVGAAQYERTHGPVLTDICVFFLGFPIGGALAGLLGRLFPSPFGAMLIGFVSFFPMFLLAGLTDPQLSDSVSGRVVIAAVAALLLGGPLELLHWSRVFPTGPPWLTPFRRPTALAVGKVWLVAAGVATVAWMVGTRWSGTWLAAVSLAVFLGAALVAVSVTVGWLHHRPGSSSAGVRDEGR
jgi:hypothetical protein